MQIRNLLSIETSAVVLLLLIVSGTLPAFAATDASKVPADSPGVHFQNDSTTTAESATQQEEEEEEEPEC